MNADNNVVSIKRWLADNTTPEPAPPPATTRAPGLPIGMGGGDPYALAALADECAKLAACPEGGRNQQLNTAAFNMGGLIASGHINRDTVTNALTAAARQCGLDDNEISPTIRSGYRGSDTKVGARVLPELTDHTGNTTFDAADDDEQPTAATLETLEGNFWTSRDSLQLIYQAALSRMASPWAVLACCAARILCLAPPTITLPAIIGGAGTLNWFAAISAKSGGGKGAAMSVASQLVDTDLTIRGIGSGEGMIETYQRASKNMKDPPPPVTAVLFSLDEIDSLGAMGGRSGQTTMSIIRQGFSGETLGYSYRGRQAETVPAHTYRMTMVAAVQPARAGVLFDDAGGGTPQRFMWFPGRDKRITAEPRDWPRTPAGNRKTLPLISPADLARAVGTVTVPDIVPATIRAARATSMSGDDDALDSHALYCREKFAYALALMDEHTHINDTDWQLAGVAAGVSDWCRTKAQEGYRAGRHSQARERGELRGIENDERTQVERAEYTRSVTRIAAWAVKTLKRDGPLTPAALHRAAASRDRQRLDDALTAAQQGGMVALIDGKWVAQ